MEVFERSDLTYTNPGRRDHVYTGKVNGEKKYVQNRYLLWSLRDALKITNGAAGFKDEFGESLSYSRFYHFIKGKKQIILQKDIPETCFCEICENASLMAKAVRKRKNAHPTNAHDIVERYPCDSKNISCITNDCAECKPEKILESWDASSDESESNSDSDEEVDTITFSTWTREDKKIKKVVKSLDKDEFYKQWQQTVIHLKARIHRKRVQMESYNN